MIWSDYFYYDETSPTYLRWAIDVYSGRKLTRLNVSKGDSAGTIDSNGYFVVRLNRKGYRGHRIVWEIHNGEIPEGHLIDHIDGNKSNNSIVNLRSVNAKHSAQNCRKSARNSSGISGVSKWKGKAGNMYWRADWVDCKQVCKYFSINKLGDEAAFSAAVFARERAIAALNAGGADYTERHGK